MDLDDNATCFIREFDITWSLRRRLHRRLGVNHQHRDCLGSAGADLLGGFKQSSQITRRSPFSIQSCASSTHPQILGTVAREVSPLEDWRRPLVFSSTPAARGCGVAVIT